MHYLSWNSVFWIPHLSIIPTLQVAFTVPSKLNRDMKMYLRVEFWSKKITTQNSLSLSSNLLTNYDCNKAWWYKTVSVTYFFFLHPDYYYFFSIWNLNILYIALVFVEIRQNLLIPDQPQCIETPQICPLSIVWGNFFDPETSRLFLNCDVPVSYTTAVIESWTKDEIALCFDFWVLLL